MHELLDKSNNELKKNRSFWDYYGAITNKIRNNKLKLIMHNHRVGILISSLFILIDCMYSFNVSAQSLKIDSSLIDSLGTIKYTLEISDSVSKVISMDTNGIILYYHTYVNDNMDGFSINYYKTGRLKQKTNKVNGLLTDTILGLYPNGDTSEVGVCIDHKCDVNLFYRSGALEARYEVERIGYLSGYYEEYYENGQLKQELDYTKKVQDYIVFGHDGKILIKGKIYRRLIPIGKWKFYWPGSSILQKEGKFSKEGGEIGVWRYYTQDGELEYEENY